MRLNFFTFFFNLKYRSEEFINAYEPTHQKNNNLHMQKQRRRSAVTAQLISIFVFAIQVVQYNPTVVLWLKTQISRFNG